MKEPDKIDRLFQETFDGFEAIPDALVKTNIDDAIAEKKRKKRPFFWLFPILFALGFPIYLFFNSADSKHSIKTANESVVKTLGKSEDLELNSTINQKNNPISEKYTPTISSVPTSNHSHNENTDGLHVFKTNEEKIRTSNVHNKSDITLNKTKDGMVTAAPILSRTEDLIKIDINPKIVPSDESKDHPLANNSDDKKIPKNTSSDSINMKSTESKMNTISLDASKKDSSKWFIALYSGYDRSTKIETTSGHDMATVLSNENYNQFYAQFYSSKLELSRRIKPNLDVTAGLGFQWNSIQKTETNYFLDSALVPTWPITSLSDSTIYFMSNTSEEQKMTVASLLVPIGITYSRDIYSRVGFRCSAVAEMSFGKLRKEQMSWELSNPTFHTFGLNMFIRPELNYSLGKMKVGLYGTINQPIYNQLTWDNFSYSFTRFGGGISLLYPLK